MMGTSVSPSCEVTTRTGMKAHLWIGTSQLVGSDVYTFAGCDQQANGGCDDVETEDNIRGCRSYCYDPDCIHQAIHY